MKADLVGVLEAAYRLDVDERAWLHGLAEAARVRFDHGLGVLAFTYDVNAPGVARTSIGIGPDMEMKLEGQLAIFRNAPRDVIRATFTDGKPFGLRSNAGSGDTPTEAVLRARVGYRDVLGLLASNPSGRGVCLAGGQVERRKPTAAETKVWTRVSTHVAAAFRLRERSTAHDAVLSPNGRVEHAEEPAKSRDARDALSAMARAIDKARGRLRRSEPEEAVAIWRALAAGRWSLVEHFDHDGRRYLIARPNEPETRAWATLTARERTAVAFAAMGHTNKLIAYELGLAPSTVAMQLSRAARKVGARSRVELIAAYKRDAI